MVNGKKNIRKKASKPKENQAETVRMKQSTAKKQTMLNVPNILTMGRVLVIPVILVLMSTKDCAGSWAAGWLFVAAGITDFFDGYLARKMKIVSSFGRFLDPIADKILVSSVILLLAYSGSLTHYAIFPATIILVREILVSGLREFLAELRVLMPVSRLAKWKTATQLVAMPMMIVGECGAHCYFDLIGPFFFWIAAILTMKTGWDYLRAGWKYLK